MPHIHTDVWVLSNPIFAEAPTDLERPPIPTTHSCLVRLPPSPSKVLGSAETLSQMVHAAPFAALLLCEEDGMSQGRLGSVGAVPRRGSPKERERKHRVSAFSKKTSSGRTLLPFLPPPSYQPSHPLPLQGPSLSSPALIWNPVRGGLGLL